MRAHVIDSGRVVNTIEIESFDKLPGVHLVDASLGGKIGDLYDEATGVFSEPAPELPAVPESIEALQGLKAVDQAGLSAAYEAWANAPERTFIEKAFINKAQTWRRDDPVLIAGATALGLTSAQVDSLFILGATL